MVIILAKLKFDQKKSTSVLGYSCARRPYLWLFGQLSKIGIDNGPPHGVQASKKVWTYHSS
jgi:hypothetical protein